MRLSRGDKHITKEMRKNPQKYIPNGMYCYMPDSIQESNNPGEPPTMKIKSCPFWDKDLEMPEQENGYCHYLKQGDWEINIDGLDTTTLEYFPEHAELEGKSMRELMEMENCPVPIMNVSLLWDQCKECGINQYDEEEDEYYSEEDFIE